MSKQALKEVQAALQQRAERRSVKQFRGEHAYLSNFYPAPVTMHCEKAGRMGSFTFPTVEHYFQVMKVGPSLDGLNPYGGLAPIYRMTPGQVKRFGRKVKLRSDWDLARFGTMFEALMNKFDQHPALAAKLVAIQGHIAEGNNHGDRFWGMDLQTKKGSNVLGQLLMLVREYHINGGLPHFVDVQINPTEVCTLWTPTPYNPKR